LITRFKGFNTAFSEQTFQPLWFDIIGIVFTIAGILLFFNNKQVKLKAEHAEGNEGNN